MNRNDLEKNKFDLEGSKVVIKTSAEIPWIENIWNRDINDMEKEKFDSNWNIRTIIII